MPGGRSVRLLSPVLALCLLVSFSAKLPAAADNASLPGDAVSGRRLFTGERRFVNGGAPCIACHSVPGLPGGGGVMGPDLSKTFADYGADGLLSALSDLSFQTMRPLYANRPLRPEEQAHLAEFLRTAGDAAPDGGSSTTAAVALAAIAALFLLLLAFGRGRLAGVRKPLLENRTCRRGIVR